MNREFYFQKTLELISNPEALWPLVSDTSRFNHDIGLPAVKIIQRNGDERLVEMNAMGLKIQWREVPFDWVAPSRFSVSRVYRKGPLKSLRVTLAMEDNPSRGTKLHYQVWVRPANLLGWLTIPFSFGWDFMRKAVRVFYDYDQIASQNKTAARRVKVPLTPSARSRVENLRAKLLEEGGDATLTERFLRYLMESEDFSLQRIRPYLLADAWKVPRGQLLELFLRGTRLGLTQFQWEVLCPLCRGAENKTTSLSGIQSQVHCGSCNIDYTANLDQQVELTFKPSPSIRPLPPEALFCAGSPQITPHIMAQFAVNPGKTQEFLLNDFEAGRYRARVLNQPGSGLFRVTEEGSAVKELFLKENWPDQETLIKPNAKLLIQNTTANARHFIFERMVWSDSAVTAREVILMPLFRDLFAREALRPGEKISVGSVAVVFTDLRGSTKLYREIGDATAFGAVMDHFDVVFKQVRAHGGVLIKTIGDAVMAVFSDPGKALRAMARAQRELAHGADGRRPLYLKAGIHFGHAIAVTENERLDYFGTTVNIAARLASFSSGEDIVMSGAAFEDPETIEAFSDLKLSAHPFQVQLKGFENEYIELHRIKAE